VSATAVAKPRLAPLAWVEDHPWLALAPVLVIAAVVLLAAGSGSSFSGDELYYFGRQAYLGEPTPRHFDALSLEYLFVPYNGHLQVGGKLVYEALFGLFGAAYVPFRIVAVVGALGCVALFYALARRRIGGPAALLLSLLLALLGSAWEVLLWPFDIHTTFAVAAGLGALLALERRELRFDALACGLLVFAIGFIEISLAFVAAAAVAILIERDRWRRIWVVMVPAALFAIWYAWAQSYAFPPLDVSLADLPGSLFDSLRATMSALTGTIETGPGVDVTVIGQDTFGTVLAIIALLLFAWRLGRGGLPRELWPALTALLGYWVMIAFAARAEDSSRYLFAGALLLLLAGASCVRSRRPEPLQLLGIAALVALALPANLAKLQDGQEYLQKNAALTRGEFAMLELAGDRGDPDYLPVEDPQALAVGASPYLVMPTAVYLDEKERIGSLADPLDKVRGEGVELRRVDDWTLVGALGITAAPAGPGARSHCGMPLLEAGNPGFELPEHGVRLRNDGAEPWQLSVSRFAPEDPGRPIGSVEPGRGTVIAIPGSDAASERWRLVGATGSVCLLPLG
jgi:hypothetical protein